MDRGKKILINTALLTVTSLLMRAVSMAFQVYLSRKIGAEGLGLFQLVGSVNVLAATFAISGIRFASTRLVSEELGAKNGIGIKTVIKKCLVYALCFGSASAIVLFYSAEFIAEKLISNVQASLPLKILALSLPAVSAATVLSGYFTAVCRIIRSSAAQIIQFLISAAVTIILFSSVKTGTAGTYCAVVVAGGVVSDLFLLLILFIFYRFDIRLLPNGGKKITGVWRRIFGISIPLALSAYARTALGTVQNLLIPRGLKRSGLNSADALARYGMVTGMVFPIITFPSAFFYALADLLVPELTQAQVQGRDAGIRSTAERTLGLCMSFSFFAGSVLFVFSKQISETVYKNAEISGYIRIMSLLTPIMYLDSITDGMLRGLGEQLYSMRINIIDSAVSILMLLFLLPRYAVGGYLFMVAFTEVINFSFSIGRLKKVSHIRIFTKKLIPSLFCAVGAVSISVLLLRIITLPLDSTVISLCFHILLSAIVYLIMLVLFGCLSAKRFFRFFSEKRGKILNFH